MAGDDGRRGARMLFRALVLLLSSVPFAGCGRPAPAPAPSEAPPAVVGPSIERPRFPPAGDGAEELEAAAMRDAAFDEAEELVTLDPESAAAWGILAALHRRYGDADGSRRLWEHALVVDPRHADAHRQLGEAAFDAGDLDEAERCYRLALAADPGTPEVAGQLADTLIRRANLEGAAELLEAFVASHPRVADAWCMLGKTRSRQGDVASARKAYDTALGIDPESREAHQGLGRLLQSLGDADAARPHLREVVRLDDAKAKRHRDRIAGEGDREGPRAWVAKVHHDAGVLHARRGDAARAERAWLASLELDPESVESRALLTTLYARSGRMDDALRLAAARCERTPDEPEAWLDLARGRLAAGRSEAAEEAIGELLALDGDHAAGLALQARVVADRDPVAALGSARRAVAIDPSAPHLYVLADMLVRAGNREEAIAVLERAVELAPEDPRYSGTLLRLRGGR